MSDSVTFELGDFRFEAPKSFSPHMLVLVGPAHEAKPVRLATQTKPVAFRANLTATPGEHPLAPDETLDSYVAEQVAGLAALSAFTQIERRPVPRDAGTAVLQHHRFANQEGMQIEQLQLYAEYGGRVLVLTATHLAGDPFDSMRDSFEHMLLSVELGGPPSKA